MEKWEYCCRYQITPEYANELGEKGWELVSLQDDPHCGSRDPMFWFKRKKESKPLGEEKS